MSHTLLVQHWTFHTARVGSKKRQDFQPCNLNGLDLLDFVRGLSSPGTSADADKRQRWTRIDTAVPRGGRSLLVGASSGRYGEAGDLIDRTSGNVAYSYTKDHAPTSPTRTLVVVPDAGLHAIAFYERSSSTGVAGVELLNELWKRAFLARNLGITWQADWIDEPETWLEEAKLKAIEVHRYAGDDRSSAPDASDLGEFIYAARARRSRFLGGGTLQSVLKDAATAHKLIGVEYQPEDRVFVELKVGDRQAKYQIGAGGLPKLQRSIDDGLDDDQFVSECTQHAVERVFPGLGASWSPDWAA